MKTNLHLKKRNSSKLELLYYKRGLKKSVFEISFDFLGKLKIFLILFVGIVLFFFLAFYFMPIGWMVRLKKNELFKTTQINSHKKNIEKKNLKGFWLFPPVEGMITDRFDANINHLALDIAAPTGEAVKAVQDGVAIFSDWTPQTGYVLILNHPNGFISIYKHNQIIYKKVGEKVRKGEVVAAVGNTGELTTGPHLHFELWYNGTPVNPEDYIKF